LPSLVSRATPAVRWPRSYLQLLFLAGFFVRSGRLRSLQDVGVAGTSITFWLGLNDILSYVPRSFPALRGTQADVGRFLGAVSLVPIPHLPFGADWQVNWLKSSELSLTFSPCAVRFRQICSPLDLSSAHSSSVFALRLELSRCVGVLVSLVSWYLLS
jgi:hypothetical protein